MRKRITKFTSVRTILLIIINLYEYFLPSLYPENPVMDKNDGELPLNKYFNEPNHAMVHFLDQLVRGLARQNTLEVQMGFSSEV